jgi:hypothetical protein
MFNKEAAICGTNYNPAHDVLPVPIQVETLKEAMEFMTIEIVPTAKGELNQYCLGENKSRCSLYYRLARKNSSNSSRDPLQSTPALYKLG